MEIKYTAIGGFNEQGVAIKGTAVAVIDDEGSIRYEEINT